MPAKPIRVLVVNDETTLRRSLTVPLTAIGYLVEEAPDGDVYKRQLAARATCDLGDLPKNCV